MELDDAEEAEVVAGHRRRAGRLHHGTRSRPGRRREADLHDDQPEVVGARSRLRRHGGGPGAERRHADRPGRARGAFAARLLPAADESGVADDPRRGQRARRAVVQHPAGDERGGGQGDLPDDVLVPRSGRRGQLPAPHGSGRPATVRQSRGSRRPSRSTSVSSGRPSVGRTAPTSRPGAAGSAPGSRCPTTRRSTPASWPTSRT